MPVVDSANLATHRPFVQQLDPRHVALGRVVGHLITATLSAAALVALVLVATLGSPSTMLLATLGSTWVAATTGLAWLAHRWPVYEFRRAAYELRDDEIEIRGGVVWRHIYKVPHSRVQHTDVAQGPLERRYGLATLVIHTAGTKHARVELGGLAHETALAIRDRLLPRDREHADAV